MPNVSLTQFPTGWNEKTIVDNAIQFLVKKKEELKIYQNLWKIAISNDPTWPSDDSLRAANKYKAVVETSKRELESLNRAITPILDVALNSDPYSKEVEQLTKIAIATQHGLNYFNTILDNTYFPTRLKEVGKVGMIAGTATLVAVCLQSDRRSWHEILNSLSKDPTSNYIALSLIVGVTALAVLVNSEKKNRITRMEGLFEEALKKTSPVAENNTNSINQS